MCIYIRTATATTYVNIHIWKRDCMTYRFSARRRILSTYSYFACAVVGRERGVIIDAIKYIHALYNAVI